MMAMTDERGRFPSSVPARNPDQLLACSPDRKRWMRVQVKGQSFDQWLMGMST